LVGTGIKSTVLSQDADVNVIEITAHGCEIANMKITGTVTNPTKDGIVIKSCRNLIKEVEVEKTYNGIQLYGDNTPIYCYWNTLVKCYIHHCINDGVHMNDASPGYCNNLLALDCDVNHNGNHGFHITRYCRIIGGQSSYNSGKGFNVTDAHNIIHSFAEGNDGGNGIQGRELELIGGNPYLYLTDPRYTDRYFQLAFSGYYKRADFNVDGTTVMQLFDTGRLKAPAILNIPTSAPASPQEGDMYFDSATNTLYIYNGSAWVSVTLT